MSRGAETTPWGERDRSPSPVALIALFVTCGPVFFWGLGSYSLVNGDEAFYQAVAETMVESGDWWTVEFRGTARPRDAFLNAPIHYWARAALITIFGSNLWTVRVFSAFFGAATVFLTYAVGLRLRGRRAGLVAAAFLIVTYQFVFLHSARTGELETSVSFVLLLSAFTFWRALETGGTFWWHHASLVVLVNLKSPLVLVPVLADAAVLLASRKHRARFVEWLRTGLLVVPLAVAWHTVQWFRLGDAAGEGLASLADSAVRGDEGRGPLRAAIFYARWLLVGAFPWSLLVPAGIVAAVRRARESTASACLAVYPLAVLAFYCVVKIGFPWYVVPLYPFLAILTAVWLVEIVEGRAGLGSVVYLGTAVPASILLAAGRFGTSPFERNAASFRIPFRWRWDAVDGAIGILVLAATAALLLWYGNRATPRFVRVLVVAAIVACLSLGGWSVSGALREVGHTSEMARVRLDLDRRLVEGAAPELPLPLSRGRVRSKAAAGLLVRYYFADDFVVRTDRLPDTEGGRPRRAHVLAAVRRPRRDSDTGRVEWSFEGHPGRAR